MEPAKAKYFAGALIGLLASVSLVACVAVSVRQTGQVSLKYAITKPVYGTKTRQFDYLVFKISKSDGRISAVPEKRVFTQSYFEKAEVPEVREQQYAIQRDPSAVVRLWLIGGFGILFTVFFLMLLVAWGRSVIQNKPPPKYVRDWLSSGLTLVVGALGGFMVAPTSPTAATVVAPEPASREPFVYVDPKENAETIEQILLGKLLQNVETLMQLNVEIPRDSIKKELMTRGMSPSEINGFFEAAAQGMNKLPHADKPNAPGAAPEPLDPTP